MKKIIISSCLVIAAHSFSFRPLKNVYYQMTKGPHIIYKINSFQEVENLDEDYFSGCYLYDKATSILFYSKKHQYLTLCEADLTIKSKIINLLVNNDKNFIENIFQDFQYRKFYYTPEINAYHINHEHKADVLKIEKQSTTLSGVKIENTQKGVILSKDGKSINLQIALKLYGENSLNEAIEGLAQEIIAQKEYISRKEFTKKLNQRENVPLDWNELDYLNHYTILSVSAAISKKEPEQILYEENKYKIFLVNGLIGIHNNHGLEYINSDKINFNQFLKFVEEEKLKKLVGQKSILIGLARDNRTGRVFYWITDLKQDISILMKYATEEYNTCRNDSDLSLPFEEHIFKKRKINK